jgi:hypothetical protein
MKKGLIILIGLLIVQTSNSQIISKNDFVNTEWFSNNTDSLFFTSDTISLIKNSNVHHQGKGYKIYYESESLGEPQSVIFQFNRRGKLNFWLKNYHWSSKAIIGERTWKIDKQTAELVIYRNGTKEWIFKPIEKNQIEFENKNQKYETTELIMIKMK